MTTLFTNWYPASNPQKKFLYIWQYMYMIYISMYMYHNIMHTDRLCRGMVYFPWMYFNIKAMDLFG